MREGPLEPSKERERRSSSRHSGLGLAAVALASVLWAVAAIVARTLFEDGVGPTELSQARAYLAFLGFGPLLVALRRPHAGIREDRTAAPFPLPKLIALGASIALVNAAYYVAIEHLPVAIAIVMQYTAPALVVAWVALAARRPPRAEVTLAVVLAVVGVALASGVSGGGDLPLIGLLAAGSSAVLFAAYTLLSHDAALTYGPTGAMFRAFGIASLFWLAFQASRGFPGTLVDPDNLWRVLYVGLAGTLAPFLLYVWGIARVKAERAVIAASLEPPAAALLAWLWLEQRLSITQIAGGVLVILAVASLHLPPRGSGAAAGA